MKAKLIKTEAQLYKLKFYNDDDMLACATELLSKQNCDSLFVVVDVDDLAYKHRRAYQDSFEGMNECIMKDAMHQQVGFAAGFNKAMELYQPKEIDVEIEMQEPLVAKARQIHGEYVAGKLLESAVFPKPKLDSEGNLILKKI